MSSIFPTKALGKDGPLVPALGFGLMGLSAWAGPTLPDAERLALLDRAYAIGARFWDTSDVYGDSEVLLGKWFKLNPEKRKDIFLATKFGGEILGDVEKGEFRLRNDEEWINIAVGRSLEKMGCGWIDLYYAHRVDEGTPVEKTVTAMGKLVGEGKVRHIGLCEISGKTLRRAYKAHRIAAVQVEYNLFSLDVEREDIGLLQACQDLGVALVAYSPLSRGLLTGAIKSRADFEPGDARVVFPRFSEENFSKNMVLVDKLAAMAKTKNCTSGQLTLAWLLAQDLVFPIPGTRKTKYLEENVGATGIKLTGEEKIEIRKAIDDAEVHGARYPEMMALNLFVDTVEE